MSRLIEIAFAVAISLAMVLIAWSAVDDRLVERSRLEDQLAKCRAQNEARATYMDSLSRCCWVQSRDGGEVYLQVPRVLP